MKKFFTTAIATVFLTATLTGCNMSRQDAGTIAGAGLGAAAGYAITDHPAGAIAGGVAGGFLGRRLAE